MSYDWDSSSSSSSPSTFSSFDSPVASPDSQLSSQDAKELQEWIAVEQEKAKLRMEIQEMTNVCFDKCVGTPVSKLDNKTESCLDNCVQRFIDVSLLVTNRFAQLAQRQLK